MPTGVYARKLRPIKERFEAKVVRLANGCWQWTGFVDKNGYGHLATSRRKHIRAHIYSFEAKHGPVPDGLQLDHTCRNRWCCNPDHLEAVTQRVNIMRGQAPSVLIHNTGKCKRGHEMTPANTVRHKRGCVAYCKACYNERRARKREAEAEEPDNR